MTIPLIPQVGAVLDFNSAFDNPLPFDGGEAWVQDGTCTLVAPDLALTQWHAVGKPGKKAVFFPGFGIVEITAIHCEKTRCSGDYLAICKLAQPVPFAPLGVRRIPSSDRTGSYVRIATMGRWGGPAPHPSPAGVQSRHYIATTGNPPSERLDNLDMNWQSSVNGNQTAERNSSGAPLLWTERTGSYAVVAVVRERRGDLQLASWIGDDRFEWLNRWIADAASSPHSRTFQADVTYDLPSGGRFAHKIVSPADSLWTISATGGSVAAALFPKKPTKKADWDQLVGSTQPPPGRFLVRTAKSIDKWLGVVALPGASPGPITVQCVCST